ncbi:tetratricopeptide repeat protein [Zavarzinella formosa]|uniref:tetratricopeptide repeat protein n=1 Tax=Zavarzinella formosa TaxID=360055 RepID=UPI001EE645A2|nr:tetratricopeptide repeat protein [Zavarzinella formosa]
MTREMVEEAFRHGHAATTVLLASRWLEAHPGDLGIVFDYAEMLYKMTRYEDAIRVYENALNWTDDSGRWAVFNQIGRLYQYWGRPADAEPWFRKAIELDPEELASHIFLGACQARQGKLSEAEKTYRAAIQWKDSGLLDEAYHNLGLVLRGQDRFAEAAECFRKAIELNPKYADVFEALKDVEKAIMIVQGDRVRATSS